LRVDAIVNAANAQLLPGGGVDGDIRNAGGAELDAELARIGYCAPGSSVLTPGFLLPARFVIHTVAPIWRGGDAEEERLLAACYSSALKLADENSIVSIAFPALVPELIAGQRNAPPNSRSAPSLNILLTVANSTSPSAASAPKIRRDMRSSLMQAELR
jgi:O-acetyl-ADP-ribose deacetylase (regulator of RNase III)